MRTHSGRPTAPELRWMGPWGWKGTETVPKGHSALTGSRSSAAQAAIMAELMWTLTVSDHTEVMTDGV